LFFRFSSELSDARLVTGLMNRFTTNWEEMQDAIDSVDEYENCEVVQNTI
jgi:hypothetical protein